MKGFFHYSQYKPCKIKYFAALPEFTVLFISITAIKVLATSGSTEHMSVSLFLSVNKAPLFTQEDEGI